MPALVAVYTDDAILMPPHAPMVRGRTAIRQFFEDFPKVTEFTQKLVEIEREGDLAFPWGTFEMAVLPEPRYHKPGRRVLLSFWQKPRRCEDAAGDSDPQVTHGVCPDCFAKLEASGSD